MAQNDFSDRLRRIDAEKGGPSRHEDAEPAIRSPKRRASGSKRPTLILSALLFSVVGAITAMAYLENGGQLSDFRQMVADQKARFGTGLDIVPDFETVLLESAVGSQEARLEERRAAEAEARAKTLIAPPPEPRPVATAPVATERMGLVFGAGQAATASGEPIPVDSIMVGFEPTGPDTPLGAPAYFEYNTECTLRPVGAAEKFVNVNVGYAQATAPLQLLDDATIIGSLEDAVQEAIEAGHSPGMLRVARGSRSAIDVIVTDRSEPLYLMLQTLGGNIVWNVHAAPGVEIAHIAMVANGSSALTGNIGNATFEAIRAADFGNQMDFYSYSGEPEELDCMARPFRKPDESWGAWAGAKRGNTLDGNLLFMRDNGHEAYDHWFTQTMGFDSATNLFSVNEASAVLVGQLSSELFSAPRGTNTLYVEQHDHILTGSATDREAETVRLYTDIVALAAGGDHRGTIPPAQEVGDVVAEAADIGGEHRDFGDLIMNKNDVESMVSLTELNRERRVNFNDRFGWDAILTEGEAIPPEPLRSLYGMLRAPKLMQPFCEDTLIEIASKCGIYKATVRHVEGDEDSGAADEFQVRADFAYIPNYNIGEVTRINNGEFVTAHLPDQRDGRSSATAEERRAFLVDLKAACEELRKEYSNCLISVAGFYIDRPARFSGGGGQASSAGWVSVYTVENRFEEGILLEKAEEIMAQVQAQ